MADGSTGQVAGSDRSQGLPRKTAEASEIDVQLTAFVDAARDSLRARGVGGKGKGRALSARVDPELLAAAAARLGVTSQTEVLNAGLAVLAGADTFGAWLLDQAGALETDLNVDV
jgi:hypothetical protein